MTGVALALGLAAPAAVAQQTSRALPPVDVRGDVPQVPFADFDDWQRDVEDGLSRGVLRERAALTVEDQRQILILQQELPELRRALKEMERLVLKARLRHTLSPRETVLLANAYTRVEAILENVPDAYMPTCRMQPRPGQRNLAPVCAVDYVALARFVKAHAAAMPATAPPPAVIVPAPASPEASSLKNGAPR